MVQLCCLLLLDAGDTAVPSYSGLGQVLLYGLKGIKVSQDPISMVLQSWRFVGAILKAIFEAVKL